jgi:Kef-type K+ transport system membrane component KefB
MLVGTTQVESRKLMRFIALLCIVLALFVAGLEATHSHAEATVARNSSPCVICLSVHANAPTVTVYLLLVFHSVEAFTLPYETQGKSAISELSLFIRPPPAA